MIVFGCSQEPIINNSKFAESLIEEHFSIGTHVNEINKFCDKNGYAIYEATKCENNQESCSHGALVTVSTPNNSWWYGNGLIQIYLTFDDNKKLNHIKHEIYYD